MPNPEAKTILESCNLSIYDYKIRNLWVGAGNNICTDPETLRKQIGTRPIDLGIEVFEVLTFDLVKHPIYPNDSSLIWSPIYYGQDYGNMIDMLTVSMPENLIKLGILEIFIIIPDPPIRNLSVYVHQKGLLFTDIPDAWQSLEASGEGLFMSIVHEVEDLLHFDAEQCEDSKDYIYDQCQLKEVRKVSSRIN